MVNPNEDTEFNDALRARGILPPKPPSRSPSPDLPTAAQLRQHQLALATPEQLASRVASLVDGGSASAEADDELRLLEALRRQRSAQRDQRHRARQRFGRVYPISRPDYTREVTEASKEEVPIPQARNRDDDDDGEDEEEEGEDNGEEGRGRRKASREDQAMRKRGTGVVCFLYKDGIESCKLLAGILDRLAAKYPATKFVSIVGDQCIPNYPDRNLPTMLVYRAGELHRQIVGLRPEIGLPGLQTRIQDVEFVLTAVGALDPEDARTEAGAGVHNGGRALGGQADGDEEGVEEDEDEDEQRGGGARTRGGGSSTTTTTTRRDNFLGRRLDKTTGGGGGGGGGGAARGGAGKTTTVMSQEEEDELDWD